LDQAIVVSYAVPCAGAVGGETVQSCQSSRIVVPIQFVPNLIAALQEHLRVCTEKPGSAGWTRSKAVETKPVH